MTDDPAGREMRTSLAAEFETEVTRLAANASRSNAVESVMRIRALREIADLLTTESLLILARDLADDTPPAADSRIAFRYRHNGRA